MADLILVLNAGSSSLKFTVYDDRGDKPKALYDGQIEGLFTESRFKAKDGSGKVVAEKTWPAGSA
ncbi:MAG TPA: acetate kinase, partial [Deltaproteobacteria bacterium]|nr:acetate kinase [Deltaproteobacteria bacterium]